MSSDITIDKFTGTSYHDWETWFDDYKLFGELKKWSVEKKVIFVRFFVEGNVKEVLRQSQLETLEQVDAAAKKVLGGIPDQLSAARSVDAERYRGDIQDYLLRVRAGVRHAYPHLTDQARDSVTLLHLHRALPVEYGRELTRDGCSTLDAAIKVIESLERADQLYGTAVSAVHRVPVAGECRPLPSPPAAGERCPEPSAPPAAGECGPGLSAPPATACFVCGQPGHCACRGPAVHRLAVRVGKLRGEPVVFRGASTTS